MSETLSFHTMNPVSLSGKLDNLKRAVDLMQESSGMLSGLTAKVVSVSVLLLSLLSLDFIFLYQPIYSFAYAKMFTISPLFRLTRLLAGGHN